MVDNKAVGTDADLVLVPEIGIDDISVAADGPVPAKLTPRVVVVGVRPVVEVPVEACWVWMMVTEPFLNSNFDEIAGLAVLTVRRLSLRGHVFVIGIFPLLLVVP